MKSKIGIISVLLTVVLCGCATTKRLQTDTRFQAAAESLVRDYLEGQKAGESARTAAQKYGGSPGTFRNLVDYRIEGVGSEMGWPSVFIRAKGGNLVGGVLWKDYTATVLHNAKLEAEGDRYMGLRISSITETPKSLFSQ